MRRSHDVVCALQRSGALHAVALTATEIKRRPWASALFAGVRLNIVVTGDDDDALDAWLIALSDIELPLSGQFVASAEVVERSANAATIELLVLDA